MKYYIHKETGEPMASFDELLDLTTGDNSSDKRLIEMKGCVTRVVFPNKWMGNGILFHVIHYSDLKKFKRISEKKFFELCPDFGQLRHWEDKTIERYKYTELFQGIRKRKLTFGTDNPNKETYENTFEDE